MALRLASFVAAAVLLTADSVRAQDSVDGAVRRVSSRTYVHGMTADTALAAVGHSGVPSLLRLLDDPSFERRDNVVAFLAYLGGSETTPVLVRALDATLANERRPADVRARLLIPEALGRLAGRGDRRALDKLLALTRAPAGGATSLTSQAVRALAFANAREAVERLGAIERELSEGSADREVLLPAASEARAIMRPGASVPAPATGVAAAATYAQDPNGTIHQSALTWAEHADLAYPMSAPEAAAAFREMRWVLGAAYDDKDVACCATLVGPESGASFGASGDGHDVIDGQTEFDQVLRNPIARVKVVNLINWCGSAGTNIIGCSVMPGNGMVVVALPYGDEIGKLWAHEYGHNIGLGHSSDPLALMYPVLEVSQRVTSTECARFHAPPPEAEVALVAAGACVKDDDPFAASIDNCPAIANADQGDRDGDAKGDVCDPCPFDNPDDSDGDAVCQTFDNCPGAANGNQADTDGDLQGDVCDACPYDEFNDRDGDGLCAPADNCRFNPNPDQADREQDGVGDVCDNCIDVANADQADADGDWHGDACDRCPEELYDDLDGDGVCAPPDVCPLAADPLQVDLDGDRVGDVCDVCLDDSGNDADSDGLCAAADYCPNVPNDEDTQWLSPVGFAPAALAVVPDVNGDGRDELVVGDTGYGFVWPDVPPYGRALLFLGADGGVETTAAWSGAGAAPGLAMGAEFASGDFDGDGRSDLAVSGLAGWGARSHVDVYRGVSGGFAAVPSWFDDGAAAGSAFGTSMAAGDFNGDGYDDLVVGEPYFGHGRAVMYFGSAQGPALIPSWTMTGTEVGEEAGMSVAAIGDVNGDGFEDLAVGDFRYDYQTANSGSVYVYAGTPAGPSVTPDWVLVTGNTHGSLLGSSLAGVGDVDGDGFDDLVAVSDQESYPAGDGPRADSVSLRGWRPRAFLFRGGSNGPIPSPAWVAQAETEKLESKVRAFHAGDVDGDGHPDILIAGLGGNTLTVFGGAAEPTAIHVLQRRIGGDKRTGFGSGPAAAGRDLDGDGRPDIAASGMRATTSFPVGGFRVFGSKRGALPRVEPDADGDRVGDACDNCPAAPNPSQADFDRDGRGDACESGAGLADADRSGRVDGLDLARLGRAFGAAAGEPRYDAGVDYDKSGLVDGGDLALFAAEFGKSSS